MTAGLVTPAVLKWAERARPPARVTGCTVRPAALDLANLVPAGSPEVARYADTWQQLTGQPLSGAALELGYRWAALQIPVQYLSWTTAHQSTRDTEAALDRIEQALTDLPS
jgi:hypothetical protein